MRYPATLLLVLAAIVLTAATNLGAQVLTATLYGIVRDTTGEAAGIRPCLPVLSPIWLDRDESGRGRQVTAAGRLSHVTV